MDEKVVPSPCLTMSEDKSDSLYPLYFGVSCAFFALRLLSEPDAEDERWCYMRKKMLQGSAQLLGLLVWRVQREEVDGKNRELLVKLDNAEKEREELKRIRREDAKANEKVVCIFAAQEQSWFNERKKLRMHIGALMNELRVVEKKKDEDISELNDKLKELELLVQSKDKALEEEEQKRKELEEKLIEAKGVAEELRETAKRESQEHSSEIWKHKTAFIELVSNQRQLEAEMGRALRQAEAKKRDLDSVLMQKEESVLMVQKLSSEIVKMHKDLEQKDKILSAMLRKSKLDTAEKQMLLKEVKLSKTKRKQAELETERWKAVSQSRPERHSLRSMLAKQASNSNATGSSFSHMGKTRSHQPSDSLLGYEHLDFRNDPEGFSSPAESEYTYTVQINEDLADVKQLEGWVRSEAEKYATVLEQRHHLEIEAFSEQLRLKDEKLEALRWRLLSMELESKRLQAHVEGLNKELSQMRHNNMKMEALLLEREEELNSLKEQYETQLRSLNCQKNNLNSSLHDSAADKESIWPQVKIIKRLPGEEEEQETKKIFIEMSQEEATENEEGMPSFNQSKDVLVQSPEKEFDEQKDVLHQGPTEKGNASPVEIDDVEKLASPSQQPLNKTNSSPWRMDLHALGVSYKIKRLKQQLLMLERLTGKQESGEDMERNDDGENGIKVFLLLMSLLNKQVGRYQSLQGKVDDLCKRMHENDLELHRRDSNVARTKDKTKTLEHFLEETFQLQRYIVATGQKLIEVQSKITSGFVGLVGELDKSAGFDMNRFADSIKTLFQETQRGLEVRIARIIGDLEGTMAYDGMIRLRR
uniref:myosin heavy chain, clone 203 n=1 Tax=Ziziphus jujuba TaxID=326968 RepID=A0A6P3ZI62_ZIZJJ